MLSIWEKSIQMQGLPSAEKTRLMAALRNGRNSQPKPTLTLTSEILMNSRNLRSFVDSRIKSDITSLAQPTGVCTDVFNVKCKNQRSNSNLSSVKKSSLYHTPFLCTVFFFTSYLCTVFFFHALSLYCSQDCLTILTIVTL